jgi:predicted unusual protein kinase regulating ubiquinone biosynthesis (AarF/ABC1/UbiB family)
MPLLMSLLPPKLSRYSAVASLLLKYGRSALVSDNADPLAALRDAEETQDGEDTAPERLARDLEALGPTFIKLGQLLSTRADLLPPPYLQALSRLQDSVSAFPFTEVQTIVEQELGVKISKAFSAFDEEPEAAASLGQVHKATLRDGRVVAVKVQRPGIVERVAEDIRALEEVAAFLDKHAGSAHRYNVKGIVQEFKEALVIELDYRREAGNLRLIGRNLAQFEQVFVPAPIDGYTTTRVLTMDYVRGTKVTALSPLARIDIDGEALAKTLIRAYLKQIIVDGVFHADPHPGNVFLTEDGRIALIDLGMVGRISSSMQETLLKLLLAVADGRGEEAASVIAMIGEKVDGFDEQPFKREIAAMVSRHAHDSLADLEVGRIFLQLNQIAALHGIRAPAELTMLGKTLLNLDQVGRALDPALDVNRAIRQSATDLMGQRLARSASAGGVYATVLEAKEFAERLPGRVNRVLDALATSELKLKVEMIDEGAVIEGLQKVANRITLGLILAALIVGAAMIMRVETSFRIFGYPGLAMILFLVAGTGGAWLAFNIVTHDRAPKHRS